MVTRIDFSHCEKTSIRYTGADEKIGIRFLGANYMLKFAGRGVYGEWYIDISEYLCSEIFKYLGIPVQDTLLGTFEGRKVVACKDLFEGKAFKPFNELGDSSIDDKERYSYSFDEIYKLIEKSSKILDKDIIKRHFWNTYIVDALLANPDRHGRNWGFIYENGAYKICPIFDNGASLFAKLTDEAEIRLILENEEEMKERVYDRPISLIKTKEGLATYFAVISSKQYEDCNAALLEIFPKINMDFIFHQIDSVDMSNDRKELLKKIVSARYQIILKQTYEELQNGKQ